MAIAIEVSTTQKQVHVEDLVHTLVSNRRNVLMGVESDWTLVDTAETAEEAVKKAAFWDGIMISRRDNNG